MRQNGDVTVTEPQHPPNIEKIIKNLFLNFPLSVADFDSIIEYLKEKKEQKIKIEFGEGNSKNLEEKIFNVLQEKSKKESKEKILEALKSNEKVLNAVKVLKNSKK